MKKVSTFILIVFVFIGTSLNAQSKLKKDREAIKSMCGCYEVTFNFAETFNNSEDSLYQASANKISKGLEWAELVTDNKKEIVIQHILQVGNPQDPMIVKHWRQDWLYQNTDFYMFDHDNKWTYKEKSKKDVKGQWTQKVYQVDDSPRYEGTGTWVHVDDKNYWESVTDAPLPRREYTKRSDYNVTKRQNRHEITDNGWVHDQDNAKIIRKDGEEDVILAYEKGYNTYVKVDDSKCQAARDWWKENNEKWAKVRATWNEVFARNQDLSLKEKVDFKVMFKHLFDDEVNTEEEIDTTIKKFIKS